MILVLGGARSGKSHYAVRRARQLGGSVLFCATAEARDRDMEERIRRHRAERPVDWGLLEEPLRPAAALEREHPGRWDVVVVDCVTLLVSNHLLLDPDGRAEDPLEPVRPGSGEDGRPADGRIPVEDRVHAEIESLVATLATRPWVPVVVSNEVGAGIVPANRVARRFRDLLGTVNQGLARRADEVVLMVAGRAVPIAAAEGANEP